MKRLRLLLAAMLLTFCAKREAVVTKAIAHADERPRFVAMGTPGTLVAGNGAMLVSTHCVSCHSVDMIRQQRLSEKQWTATIEKMTKWGATLPESDRATAIAYLSQHYGPRNRFVPFETSPAPVEASVLPK